MHVYNIADLRFDVLKLSNTKNEYFDDFVCMNSIRHTVWLTRYRTRHFFNNSNTNEDIAKKFEQE